ncbi:sensor histidine kinase [Corynebacterium halotolerans]|uniref:Heme-responsive histidine kinase n=1 Tax=Corynebacterium halotolerans YIM 70093 = DSM 44683 TaxID=1121362 RepID=M1NQT3_9CORY|nr:histidine kinase [Corynebacterium halotolerans]AGF73738.1 heme-responsive histidine kinase [Corynebacterium halotolerans YIM 70093 = DSM 44683]
MTPSPTPQPTPTPLPHVLKLLRLGLHMMFAFLLVFGLLRHLLDDPRHAVSSPVLPLVLALGGIYLTGTLWENRHARGATGLDPTPFAPAWLASVTALWVGLVVLSIDFVWLLFPLVFLFLHLTWPVVGIPATVLLWAVAAFAPAWLHPEAWTAGAAVGPAIGAVFAVAIYYAYRALHAEVTHHRRVAEQLRATRAELADSEHQAGRLEERERLSREIHDTVAQGLSSILLVARAARGTLDRGDAETAARQLGTIEEAAADNLAEARRFVRDLASPALGESLPEALRQVIERTRARQEALGESLDISLHLAGDTGRPLPEPVNRTVLRAAQEALANVVKHAQASMAVVTLEVWDDSVTLDVFDDGRSFDGGYGYGLRGLEARVSALHGDLVIETGDGTALAVHLPLTSQREDTP